MLTASLIGASSSMGLVMAPLQAHSAAAPVHMSMSRRAVISTLPFAAALPFPALAVSLKELVTDEKELASEEAVLKSTDAKLKGERNIAFQEEIALTKANDAYLEALKSGDKKKAAELSAKIKTLQAKYAADEQQVLALTKEEANEVALEKKTLAKVKKEELDELKQETDEMLVAEVANLENNVGAETTSIVGRFLTKK